MKQTVDPSNSPDFSSLSSEQLIKLFARYGFRDSLGHPLEHCQDFLTLIAMVKTESQVNECS